MRGNILLSEIHPLGVDRFHPAKQAHEWFGLLNDEDMAYFASPEHKSFEDGILRIERRAREHGKKLIIRDWAHLDFMGKPFLETPTGHFGLAEALTDGAVLHRVALARHPADQTESLLRTWPGKTMPHLDAFLAMHRHYAEAVSGIEVIRFEDFTCDPDKELRRICTSLTLDFDAGYSERWMDYKTITGDRTGSRGGFDVIRPLERKPPPDNIRNYLLNSKDYREACEILGYEP